MHRDSSRGGFAQRELSRSPSPEAHSGYSQLSRPSQDQEAEASPILGEADHDAGIVMLLESPHFQSFMAGVILFNALLMGMETDIEWGGWFIMEQFLLCIYCLELGLKVKVEGIRLLSCYNPDICWNILDVVIVASATVDTWIVGPLVSMLHSAGGDGKERQSSSGQLVMLMRMLRLLRILRLAKLVKAVRPLYILIASIMAALQGVGWVLVLTVTLLYAMGIVATRLAGHGLIWPDGNEPEEIMDQFRTVGDSMFTLFRLMAGMPSEAEQIAVDRLMDSLPLTKFSFVFFMISSSWTLLSTLTAVISENMITTTQQQQDELALASADENHDRRIQELRELFESMTQSGAEDLHEDVLARHLGNKEFAIKVARCCRVSVRETKDVLTALHREAAVVTKDEFVDHLLSIGQACTEKSILQLEARLTEFQRRTESALSGLASDSRQHRQLDETVMDRVAVSLDRLAVQAQGSTQDAADIRSCLRDLLQNQTDLKQRGVAGFGDKLALGVGDLERHGAEAAANLQAAIASTNNLGIDQPWINSSDIAREVSDAMAKALQEHKSQNDVVAQLLMRADSGPEARRLSRRSDESWTSSEETPTKFADPTSGSSQEGATGGLRVQEAPPIGAISFDGAPQEDLAPQRTSSGHFAHAGS